MRHNANDNTHKIATESSTNMLMPSESIGMHAVFDNISIQRHRHTHSVFGLVLHLKEISGSSYKCFGPRPRDCK